MSWIVDATLTGGASACAALSGTKVALAPAVDCGVVPLVALTALAQLPSDADLCAGAVGERTLSVRVTPWADVLVDGRPVATGVIRADLSVGLGLHLVSFRNPQAFDAERTILVSACDTLPDLAVELVRRPALLEVRASVAGAAAAVCGPEVPADDTRRDPLPVSLRSSLADVEVRVSRRGFATVVKRVRLHSGRRSTVEIRLDEE